MKNKILLNPEPDGTCRTIKANYHKVSVANFVRRGGYGASAVIEWEMDAAVPRHRGTDEKIDDAESGRP